MICTRKKFQVHTSKVLFKQFYQSLLSSSVALGLHSLPTPSPHSAPSLHFHEIQTIHVLLQHGPRQGANVCVYEWIFIPPSSSTGLRAKLIHTKMLVLINWPSQNSAF
jgi:hypothetical protein